MRRLWVPWLLLLVGCATTRIVSQDQSADIYVDRQKIGVGTAMVDRVGPYHTAQLEARRGNVVVGSTSMSRSFTFKTLLWGVFSYYTGLYWGWYYPEFVEIPMNASEAVLGRAGKAMPSPWTQPRESVWMRPLH